MSNEEYDRILREKEAQYYGTADSFGKRFFPKLLVFFSIFGLFSYPFCATPTLKVRGSNRRHRRLLGIVSL